MRSGLRQELNQAILISAYQLVKRFGIPRKRGVNKLQVRLAVHVYFSDERRSRSRIGVIFAETIQQASLW